ncbi:DUF1707 domain-containing protein [Nocardiopsis baichengensis]|uniref:DUF1707 domain-containing protein n=1 Tax=Nocardiopsis baichengensis TaxID=280240 RepID=UPI00034D7A54|nr:DUF1707 domain-containing protein [Nocardiopsis baichengensis]
MSRTPSSAGSPGRSDLRVGDAERERTAAAVSDAAAAGYLRIDELDGRLEAVWSARTAGELEGVVADIPPDRAERPAEPPAEDRGEAGERRRAPGTTGFRAHLSSYIGGMTLLVGIWLVVGITAGAWYPWFIWPALGWGIGVAAKGMGVRRRERGGEPHRSRCGSRARAWERHHVAADRHRAAAMQHALGQSSPMDRGTTVERN